MSNRSEMRGNEGRLRVVGQPAPDLNLHDPNHFTFVRQSGIARGDLGEVDSSNGVRFFRGVLWALALSAAAWALVWLAWRVGV